MIRNGPRRSTLEIAGIIRSLIEGEGTEEPGLDGLHEPQAGLSDQILAPVTVGWPEKMRPGQYSLLITAGDGNYAAGGAWSVVITRVPRNPRKAQKETAPEGKGEAWTPADESRLERLIGYSLSSFLTHGESRELRELKRRRDALKEATS